MSAVIRDFVYYFRLEGVVDAVFSDRISIRKQLMELEGTQRDLSYRIHHKEKQMTRLTLFVKNPVADDQVGYER